jgi:AmmeMemoRadiSam system protein B
VTPVTEPVRYFRGAAVAGAFYPASAAKVTSEAARLVAPDPVRPGAAPRVPAPAIAVMSPHAGWMYSGALAGRLFARVEIPERVVVLAPNHTGRGVRASVWPDGEWRQPGSDIPVDEAFAAALLADTPPLEPDREAHVEEHAIEVLLPLLAARQPALRIAPIVLGGLSFKECEALAAGIARAIEAAEGATLIVASSDMNHYQPDDLTRALDDRALEPLLALDARGLWDTVRENGITMCGYIPTTVALLAARALGATRARLVGHTTSADAGSDPRRVVGYAAVSIER